MTIEKYSDVLFKQFESFCEKEQKRLKGVGMYSSYSFVIDSVINGIRRKDKELIDKIYLIFKDNGKVSGFFFKERLIGNLNKISIPDPFLNEELFPLIWETIPDIVFVDKDTVDAYLCYENLIKCDFSCSFNENAYYHVCGSYYVGSEDKKFDLRNEMEKKFFPKYKKPTFKMVYKDDFLKYFGYSKWSMLESGIWKMRYEDKQRIAGFHNFEEYHNNSYLFVAIIDGKIIGEVNANPSKRGKQTVSKVDIAQPYWGKGVEKLLIEELNKYLDLSKPLYVKEKKLKNSPFDQMELCRQHIKTKVLPL